MFELVPVAIAALDQILEWQVPRIAATSPNATSHIAAKAAGLGVPCEPEDQRGPHMLGLRLPDRARAHAGAVLATVNWFAAMRGRSLRISPHVHTTDEDVRRLLKALTLVLQPSQR